jgi:hypothetical protein
MRRHTLTVLVLSALTSVSIAQSTDGLWQSESSLPTNGEAKTHAVGIESNGRLYVLGGPPWLNATSMEDGTVYSMPVGGSVWQEENSFDGYGGLVGFGGGIDDLGRIVIFGGYDINDTQNTPTPFEWHPDEGPWHDLAERSPSAPISGFAYCSDDQGRIYSLGGSASASSNYCERYIGSLDMWEPIAPMPIPLSNAAACVDGLGHILVFGGIGSDTSVRSTEVLQYDIATNTWSISANTDMPIGVSHHRASLGADGRIYVLGGVEGPSGSAQTVSTVQVYDPMLDSWSDGATMSVPRSTFTTILGSDDRLYIIGGANSSGGTASVESIYATPCPVIFQQPIDKSVWEYAVLRLSVQTSGAGAMAYQWMRDGMPLTDGVQVDGSSVIGANTQDLRIEDFPASAEGSYTLVATNACGSDTSDPAMVSVRFPPDIAQEWTWTSLHPSFATASYANSIDNGVQVGNAVYDTPDYNNIDHPVKWTGSASSVLNLTQSGSQGGSILDFAGDKLVGWWWEPIQCYVNNQWQTCYFRRGCWWNLDGTFHETSYSGYEYTTMSATDGVSVVGSGTTDDASGNYYTRAVIWGAPTHYSAQSIHPTGYRNSSAVAVDGEYQFGTASLPFAVVHAAMWRGSASSFVDMNPDWAGNSAIVDASDGQQIGVANQWSTPRGVMWEGSPESVVDLTPEGATTSNLYACDGGLQIGAATFPDEPTSRIGIWGSSARSFTSLVDVVPSDYTGFNMKDIEVAPDGTISIVGSAYNSVLGRTEAILLTSGAASDCPADLNNDQSLNFLDVSAFLSAFGNSDPVADFTDDGLFNFLDVSSFLSAYSNGCP